MNLWPSTARRRRLSLTVGGVLVAAAGMIALPVAPAAAAVPSNDTFGGATVVSLGFSEQLDTTEATTDADDAQFNASCGAPATDASVWYSFTAAADGGVVIDVSQSDYSAGVLVGVGTEGNLDTVTCGPGTVGFTATGGTTYYVLAIDDQSDGGGNGGTLAITFAQASPPPTVSVTVDPTGRVDPRTGVAYLTGAYTCSNADFIDVYGDVRQAVGRVFTVTGSFEFFDEGTCDGASHSWSATVSPYNGKFAGGTAMTVVFADVCGVFECAEGYTEQTVRLRGGK